MTMLTRNDFWALVKEINWPHCADDYKKVQVMLLRRYTDEQISGFHDIAADCYHELRDKLWAWELEHKRDFGRTDDGIRDLLYHVIGLGQDTFESCKADPALMRDIKAEESFHYVFPSREDRQALDLAYFRKWARRLRNTFWRRHRVREVQQGLNSLSAGYGVELGNKLTKDYNEAADLTVKMLDAFLDGTESLNDFMWEAGKFELNLRTIERRRARLTATLASHHLAIKSDHGWPSTTSARNFIHDLVTYHGPAVPPS